QAAAARAWAAISRFYAHCPEKRPGKKGYPRFQQDCRSVEYTVTGWRLDADGRHLTLTDGCGIGRGNLIGSREVHTFPLEQLKRVRLLRRADGYYAQFVLEAERRVAHVPTTRPGGGHRCGPARVLQGLRGTGGGHPPLHPPGRAAGAATQPVALAQTSAPPAGEAPHAPHAAARGTPAGQAQPGSPPPSPPAPPRSRPPRPRAR